MKDEEQWTDLLHMRLVSPAYKMRVWFKPVSLVTSLDVAEKNSSLQNENKNILNEEKTGI